MTPDENLVIAVNRLCEFLLIAIHAIVHKHDIYPSRMFELRRKYGLATFHSKHPTLNAYIQRVITSLRPLLAERKVVSVAIPIFDDERVHARYVFEPVVPQISPSVQQLAALDAQLRAQLARLNATEGGGGNMWDVVVRTTGVRLNSEWVPADGRERADIECKVVVPIKDFGGGVGVASWLERPQEGGLDA